MLTIKFRAIFNDEQGIQDDKKRHFVMNSICEKFYHEVHERHEEI